MMPVRRLLTETDAPAAEPLVQKAEGLGHLLSASAAGGSLSLPWLQAGQKHTGDGTAYSDAVNNTGATFACSFR